MKKLIVAVVLATLAGTTAFAQSYNPDCGSANIAPVYTPVNPNRAFAYRTNDRGGGYGAFAQVTGSVATGSPDRIIGFDGAIEGDPDPNIRFQLRREAQEGS